MKKSIKIREAFGKGLESLQENYILWAGMVFISILVAGIQYSLSNAAGQNAFVSLVLIVISLVQIVIWLGTLSIAIKLADGKPAQINDLFTKYRLLVPLIVSSAIYTFFILSVPLILLLLVTIIRPIQIVSFMALIAACVWTFFITIKNVLYEYVMVDKETGPVVSLRKSREITKGALWPLSLFYLLATLLNISGFCLFIIGMFVTMPITLVANAHVYRQLERQTKKN
jgi:uncharacterized membrane protein